MHGLMNVKTDFLLMYLLFRTCRMQFGANVAWH